MAAVKAHEWAVAINDAGDSELVQAHPDGMIRLHGALCLTGGLVGVAYGTCLDLEAVQGPERAQALKSATMVTRFDDKWERRPSRKRRAPGKGKKKKRKTEEGGAEGGAKGDAEGDDDDDVDEDEEEEGETLFRIVKTKASVGVVKASENELVDQRAELLERLKQVESDLGMKSSVTAAVEREDRSNKFRTDSTSNQKLTPAEIHAMVDSGVDTEQLVSKLAENNTSFKEMTEYGKEKYKEKKLRKFSRKFRLVRANSMTITETLWSRATGTSFKLGQLRPTDTLAQLLGLSNAQYGSRVLLLESMKGVLLGALLERIGEAGEMYLGYVNQEEPIRGADFFNLPAGRLAAVDRVDVASLVSGKRADEVISIMEDKTASIKEQLALQDQRIADATPEERAKLEAERAVFERMRAATEVRLAERRPKFKRKQEVFELLRTEGVDSLVIASKHEPCTALKGLLPLLAPGRPFVVFHNTREPLVQARAAVEDDAREVQITEVWMREHQVLPGRTHPEMQMSGRGGFLLSGTRTIPSEAAAPARVTRENKLSKAKTEEVGQGSDK